MVDRPPFDPDDELDFDFEASRQRWRERTDEHAISRRAGEERADDESGERADDESGEVGGDDNEPAGGREDPTTGERAAGSRRGRRPRRRSAFTFGRRRRRRATAERRARRAETGDRRAIGVGAGGRGTAGPDTTERRRLRDDPFTPAEVPVPVERRRHRRDLPAKVRRRQALAIGAVAVLVVGGAILLFSGGGGDEEQPLALKRLVGQTVVGTLDQNGVDAKLTRRVRKGQVGGLIVEQRDQAIVQQDIATLQEAASAGGNPPLLVMVDQEGGDVKDLPNGPPELSPRELGQTGDADAARGEGEQTGSFLRGVGVNVDLAPVLDVELPRTADTIAERTFGDDPALVAELGTAFIEGLQSQGVAATAKHFPGLGPATINTDFSPVTIAAPAEDLDAALQPFEAAIADGVQLMMVSSASYPSLGSEKPGVFAKPVVQGLLRDDLGFDGVVITDDLQSIAMVEQTKSTANAAIAAISAGCDLVLYARNAQGSVAAFNAVTQAAKDGRLTRDRLQQSYDRIIQLKSELAPT
jgi:beta-N-acetylhexosaminidase